jgi:segregation and condensation protein B
VAALLDSIIEAILISSDEVLSADRLAENLERQDATPAAVREAIDRLNDHYNDTGRAFEIVEQAGGYRLMTRPEYGNYIRRVLKTRSRDRLSHAALETLAVVAYRQPVPRSQIENIRGVDSGAMLRMLIDKGMIKIVGREESLGHPLLYGTTRFFLETFGLKDLKSLPNADELVRGEADGLRHRRKPDSEADGEQPTDETPPTAAVTEAIAAMAEASAAHPPDDAPQSVEENSPPSESATGQEYQTAEGEPPTDAEADTDDGGNVIPFRDEVQRQGDQ